MFYIIICLIASNVISGTALGLAASKINRRKKLRELAVIRALEPQPVSSVLDKLGEDGSVKAYIDERASATRKKLIAVSALFLLLEAAIIWHAPIELNYRIGAVMLGIWGSTYRFIKDLDEWTTRDALARRIMEAKGYTDEKLGI